MLYSLYEAQHAWLTPYRYAAGMTREVLSHPFNPLAQWSVAKKLVAGNDLFLRVTHRYDKPEWRIDFTTIKGRAVPVTIETVAERPFCRLLHFRRELPDTASRDDPKVLVVAPLSGHYATLLRDTVRALLPHHDVWITDWVDARQVPLTQGPFHFADYVDTVREFARMLSPDLNVISVCQPTVPVLAAISLSAEEGDSDAPSTMIMMGGPIDARKSPTAVNNLATTKPISWFDRNVVHRVPGNYPGHLRRVYPGFLQHLGFVAMNPDRHLSAHWEYFNHLVVGDEDSAEKHREFYDEYNAVMDLPAEYYLDTVKSVFQEFSLPKGRMFVRERLVRPKAIRKTALLTIEGEMDDISGNGQTAAAHELCTGIPAARREHYIVERAGHYGIFSGRRWREQVRPKITDFIKAHSS